MKKNILLTVCFSTIFTHAMNKNSSNNTLFCIKYHGTIINLNKKRISIASGKVDCMIVGTKEQLKLQKPIYNAKNTVVGLMVFNTDNILYEKDKEDESDSDDDSYKLYYGMGYQAEKSWKKAHKYIMQNEVATIIEPHMQQIGQYCDTSGKMVSNGFYYYDGEESTYSPNKEGNDIIKKMSLDLEYCYSEILNHFSKSSKKSIALATLGTEVGFPREKAARIAITTILDFLKTNPNRYDRIELFVKKRSEFALYKKLLIQPLIQSFAPKACLFSYAAKNNQNILIPQEIINYILLFMIKA